MERGVIQTSDSVHIGPVFKQERDDLFIPLLRCNVERGAVSFFTRQFCDLPPCPDAERARSWKTDGCGAFHVSTGREEKFYNSWMVIERGKVKRGHVVDGLGVEVPRFNE